MRPKQIAVLCVYYEQGWQWIRKNATDSKADYIIVNTEDATKGRNFSNLVELNNFKENPNWYDIKAAVDFQINYLQYTLQRTTLETI